MNRIWPIPAPEYTKISGKRRPPKAWGDMLWCQLRSGICGKEPWPTATCIWIHDGSYSDIVAVKRTDETLAKEEGRQKNNSYE
jgi:hypothetical protein